MTRRRSASPTPEPPTVTITTRSSGLVAELAAELLATLDERRRVEPGDVAAERVVALRPVADRRQPRPEVVGHDVVRVADEDRPVAEPREALDVLDHLGVVVGGQERLALAAGRHRQPADEIGHPGERGPLELRVLVEEVVDVPRLVADDEVVLAALDRVVEDHEVGDEDLVHPADRLERVEVVLGRLGRDVRRFRGELRAQRVDPLAARLEHGGDRVLGEPVDLEVRVGASGARRRWRRRAGRARARSATRCTGRDACGRGRASRCGAVQWSVRWSPVRLRVMPRPPDGSDEVADQQVGEDRVAARDHVVGALDDDERRAGQLGQPVRRARSAGSVSSVPWTMSIGQVTARQVASTVLQVAPDGRVHVGEHRVDRSVERPLDGVVDLPSSNAAPR